MAFATDLVLNNAAAVAKTFTLQTTLPDGAVRIDTSFTDLNALRSITIRNQTTGQKDPRGLFDKHLVNIVHNRKNALGLVIPLISNYTLQVPRDVTITRTDVDDEVAFLKNFLITANLDRLLRNES